MEGRSIPIEARAFTYGAAGEDVVTARLLEASPAPGSPGRVRLGGKELGPANPENDFTDIQTVALAALLGLPAKARAGILEFLVATLTEDGATSSPLHARANLARIREMLRDRFPLAIVDRGSRPCLSVEVVLAVDDSSFYVRGWIREGEARTARLTAVSPEGSRTEILGRAFWHPRPDGANFFGEARPGRGFIALFEPERGSSLGSGWIFELGDSVGDGIEARAPDVVRDRATLRATILADLERERLGEDSLILDHVFPAMTRLQKRDRCEVRIEDIADYGRPSSSPDVSVIVPIFGRIDLLEHQLAQLVGDSDVERAELLYVLDSPELAEKLCSLASACTDLFRMPFRVITLSQSVGYALATSVAASVAAGPVLTLLHSDVFPDRPGWLGRLHSFYRAAPEIGALGPKLLYEDDSVQHAGLYFGRQPGSKLWQKAYRFKGFHRRLAVANVAGAAPAVSGACLMISKELFDRVGGLRNVYTEGHNEDADLCLRLIEAGCQNWYLPEVELYHLEGQARPSAMGNTTRHYDDWLLTRLWGTRIEEVMASYSEASPAEPGIEPLPVEEAFAIETLRGDD